RRGRGKVAWDDERFLTGSAPRLHALREISGSALSSSRKARAVLRIAQHGGPRRDTFLRSNEPWPFDPLERIKCSRVEGRQSLGTPLGRSVASQHTQVEERPAYLCRHRETQVVNARPARKKPLASK